MFQLTSLPLTCATISLAFLTGAAQAEINLPAATDRPILTIQMGDDLIELDRAGLATLPQTQIETTTIWTEGDQTFDGVRVTSLLDALGVDDGTLTLIAANLYQIEIPVDHFTDDGAILAMDRNGKPMSLRDKGPLWLVYDYDADEKFRTEVIYSNSIWQLERIEIGD